MMLYEEDWAAVVLRSKCPYRDTMRSSAETALMILRRSWRIARQAPRTPRGQRRHMTSAPWPGRRHRAWRGLPWPRSCSAAPSWCRWPWAGAPSCPRPPQSASCGPWSSWPEILTITQQPIIALDLHRYTGHMVTLTVFVNQLSSIDKTQGMGHDYPVIVVSPRLTRVVVTVPQCYIATCAVHTCDARYPRISVSWFSLLGPGVGASGLCSGPGAPSVTSPGQARKSPVARPGEQRAGPAKQMWAGTWDFNCFLTFKRDGEEARRMWNGDNGMIFYPTQLSNTVWGDHSCYLYCTVGQVHDDCLGGANPALDLWDGQVGVAAPWPLLPQLAGPAPCPALAALSEVLVHVLGEVAKQRELLVKGGRHLARGHGGQVVTLPELDKSESSDNVCLIEDFCLECYTFCLRSSWCEVIIEKNANWSVWELESQPVLVAVVNPLGD